MSKAAELRHGPRFKKQLAAMDASYTQHLEIERAKDAVVKAALAWFQAYEATDHYKNPWHALQDEPLREAFRAACAEYDRLDEKR